MELVYSIRNNLEHFFYTNLFKRIFFLVDPETIHNRMIKLGNFLGSNFITRALSTFLFSYKNNILNQTILNINFKNPVGLSAGFDKNALLTNILPSVGFGFAEIGSITGEYCEGNPKPRLWRLKKSKSLLVNYGLSNEGASVISSRLKNSRFKIPIGINIAKTNNKKTISLKSGIKDYVKAYESFANIGSYTTINISCPNSYGGQPFADAKKLDLLLKEIKKIPSKKPIFIKLSADLSNKKIDSILEVAKKHKIEGFICTNLTKNRNLATIFDKNLPISGGISGKVVENLSNNLISYIYKKTKGKFLIMGVGGIFSAEDAYKKIKAGASLVQLITGMIYEGPQLIAEINQGLAKLLEKDNFTSITQAIGSKA